MERTELKIVVLDGYTLNPGDLSWSELEKIGSVKVYDRTSSDKIIERIGNADIVFTNKTPISREVISSCQKLKYIGVLATGYNVVDDKAAKEAGIIVTNIPTYGTATVSQFTFALLLELCHHVGLHSDSVKAGEWSSNQDWCYWKTQLVELADKNMGVIGFGRIGQQTGKLANAFGMKVLAYDNFYQNPDLESEICKYVSLDQLLEESDVIALHCPLLLETNGIINKENISKMKDGVFILNSSRGPLINEQDLADALNSGKVGGAAVDVVSQEPINEDNPLLTSKNTIITPHMAWGTKESRARLLQIAINNLREFLDGNPQNVVDK